MAMHLCLLSGIDADCSGLPCQNNGTCIPDPGAANNYTCNCTAGFTGKNCSGECKFYFLNYFV